MSSCLRLASWGWGPWGICLVPMCCWSLGLGILCLGITAPLLLLRSLGVWPSWAGFHAPGTLWWGHHPSQGFDQCYLLPGPQNSVCTLNARYPLLEAMHWPTISITAMPKVWKRIPTSGSHNSLFPQQIKVYNLPPKPSPGREQWRMPRASSPQ